MDRPRTIRSAGVGLGLAICLSLLGCERGEVDQRVHELKANTREAAAKVDEKLAEAKDEAARLKEELPPAEKVKEDLIEAKDDVEHKLREAGAKLKEEASSARRAVHEATSDR